MGECGSPASGHLWLCNLRIPEWGVKSGEQRVALGRVQGVERVER